MLTLKIKSFALKKAIGAAFVKFIGWEPSISKLADNSLIEMGNFFIAVANIETVKPVNDETIDDLFKALEQNNEDLAKRLLKGELVLKSKLKQQALTSAVIEGTVQGLTTPPKGTFTPQHYIQNSQLASITQRFKLLENAAEKEKELIKKEIISPHKGMEFCLDGSKAHNEMYLIQLKFTIVRVFALVINTCFADNSYLEKFNQLIKMSQSGDPSAKQELNKATVEIETLIQQKDASMMTKEVKQEEKIKKEEKKEEGKFAKVYRSFNKHNTQDNPSIKTDEESQMKINL